MHSLLRSEIQQSDQQPLPPPGPRSPVLTPMEPCRSLALLVGFLGLMFCLIALSTDFWFEAVGPNHSAHSGLWPTGHGDIIAGKGNGCPAEGLPVGMGVQWSSLDQATFM